MNEDSIKTRPQFEEFTNKSNVAQRSSFGLVLLIQIPFLRKYKHEIYLENKLLFIFLGSMYTDVS